MNSKQHDIIFSITSHLPHLIAYNLVKTATDFEKGKKFNLIKFSAGGLRDFSRIAASNVSYSGEMFFLVTKKILFQQLIYLLKILKLLKEISALKIAMK
jgi:prephenate dehydrogenase (EC 1.3.1.12)